MKAISGDEQSRTEDRLLAQWNRDPETEKNVENFRKSLVRRVAELWAQHRRTAMVPGTCSLPLVRCHSRYSFTIAGRNPDPAFVEELSSYPGVDVIPDAPDLSKLYFTHHASVVPLLHGRVPI